MTQPTLLKIAEIQTLLNCAARLSDIPVQFNVAQPIHRDTIMISATAAVRLISKDSEDYPLVITLNKQQKEWDIDSLSAVADHLIDSIKEIFERAAETKTIRTMDLHLDDVVISGKDFHFDSIEWLT